MLIITKAGSTDTTTQRESKVARWFIFILKSQLGHILEGLGMANVGMFYDC
jgi:hypothetical protein